MATRKTRAKKDIAAQNAEGLPWEHPELDLKLVKSAAKLVGTAVRDGLKHNTTAWSKMTQWEQRSVLVNCADVAEAAFKELFTAAAAKGMTSFTAKLGRVASDGSKVTMTVELPTATGPNAHKAICAAGATAIFLLPPEKDDDPYWRFVDKLTDKDQKSLPGVPDEDDLEEGDEEEIESDPEPDGSD